MLAEKTIPIPLPLIPTPPTRAPTPPMAGGAGNPAPPTIAQQGFEVLAEQQKPPSPDLVPPSLPLPAPVTSRFFLSFLSCS